MGVEKEPLAASVAATAPAPGVEANPAVQNTAGSLPVREQKKASEEHLPVREAVLGFAAADSLRVN